MVVLVLAKHNDDDLPWWSRGVVNDDHDLKNYNDDDYQDHYDDHDDQECTMTTTCRGGVVDLLPLVAVVAASALKFIVW